MIKLLYFTNFQILILNFNLYLQYFIFTKKEKSKIDKQKSKKMLNFGKNRFADDLLLSNLKSSVA